MENIELQHHGTKGMRWGIRRYQNSDGSLTAEGKKRYGVVSSIKAYSAKQKKKKQLEKARVAKAEKKSAAEQRAKDLAAGKIKIKDMTDEEIKARTARLQAEKTLLELENATGRAVMNKGKLFIKQFADSTFDKLSKDATADIAVQAIKAVLADTTNTYAFKGEARVHDNNKRK